MLVKVWAGISKTVFRPLSLAEKHHMTGEDRGQVTDTFFQPLDSLPNIRKKVLNLYFVTMPLFFTVT